MHLICNQDKPGQYRHGASDFAQRLRNRFKLQFYFKHSCYGINNCFFTTRSATQKLRSGIMKTASRAKNDAAHAGAMQAQLVCEKQADAGRVTASAAHHYDHISDDQILEAACRLEACLSRWQTDYNPTLCLGRLCVYNILVGQHVGPRSRKYGVGAAGLLLPASMRYRHRNCIRRLQRLGLVEGPSSRGRPKSSGFVPTALGLAVYHFLQIHDEPQTAAYRDQLIRLQRYKNECVEEKHAAPTDHKKSFAEKRPRGGRKENTAAKPPKAATEADIFTEKLAAAVLAQSNTITAIVERLAKLEMPQTMPQPAPVAEQTRAKTAPPPRPTSTHKRREDSDNEYTTKRSSYMGHPTFIIDGPRLRNPLTFGAAKLRAIQAVWPEVQAFLAEQSTGHSSPEEEKERWA